MAKFNQERAAAALVEAAYYGDKQAAERYGLTRQTLHNYRQRLSTDDDFLLVFTIKKQAFEDGWADELPGAIRSAIRYLAFAADKHREVQTVDAQTVHAVAGSLKILADVTMTKKVLDARLTGRGEPEGADDRPLASENTPPSLTT